MAIAVAGGRVGYVLLEGDRLADWGLSQVASHSCSDFTRTVTYWIALLNPEAIVSEKVDGHCRKRGAAVAMLETLANITAQLQILHATVSKARAYQNKYDEAKALAEQFPELRPKLAEKPKIWLNEPRRMIIFEALSMALQVVTEER